MRKSFLYLPLLLCLDFKPSYSRDDISAFLIVRVCKEEDIKYSINFTETAYNIISIEF